MDDRCLRTNLKSIKTQGPISSWWEVWNIPKWGWFCPIPDFGIFFFAKMVGSCIYKQPWFKKNMRFSSVLLMNPNLALHSWISQVCIYDDIRENLCVCVLHPLSLQIQDQENCALKHCDHLWQDRCCRACWNKTGRMQVLTALRFKPVRTSLKIRRPERPARYKNCGEINFAFTKWYHSNVSWQ